ncbi:hypothetical protein E4U54_006914 [Claviceps lovelessii]|nr:hypothetical protein E4U54_006914 [Claviceps lovelessii]
MKSAMIAAAALASAASAHNIKPRAPLDLGIKVADVLDVKLCLDLDVKLPLGISAESAGCPDGRPAADRINTWHPPHHVPMDDCDDNDNDGWHYVRPCGCSAHKPHAWGTSTVVRAVVTTIVSCAPSVTDCPDRGNATTVVVPATTYICPVALANKAIVPASTTPGPAIDTPCPDHDEPAKGAVPPNKALPAPPASPAPAAPVAAVATTPAVIAAFVPPKETPAPGPTPDLVPAPAPAPVIIVAPSGTGSYGGNTTIPPAMAAAPQTTHKVGAVFAISLATYLLI